MEGLAKATNCRHLMSCFFLCVKGYIQDAPNYCWGWMGSSRDWGEDLQAILRVEEML